MSVQLSVVVCLASHHSGQIKSHRRCELRHSVVNRARRPQTISLPLMSTPTIGGCVKFKGDWFQLLWSCWGFCGSQIGARTNAAACLPACLMYRTLVIDEFFFLLFSTQMKRILLLINELVFTAHSGFVEAKLDPVLLQLSPQPSRGRSTVARKPCDFSLGCDNRDKCVRVCHFCIYFWVDFVFMAAKVW